MAAGKPQCCPGGVVELVLTGLRWRAAVAGRESIRSSGGRAMELSGRWQRNTCTTELLGWEGGGGCAVLLAGWRQGAGGREG